MISSISTIALYNAYSSDISGRKTVSSTLPSASEKEPEPTSNESPTTVVNLSSEALNALEKYKVSGTVDQFLREHGKEVYESTMKSLKGYRENLASRLSDKSLSDQELGNIHQKMVDREMDAFMKYARQDPPDMIAFYENYIEYLDTLSPEELQSQRYLGQRDTVVKDYERIIREQGGVPDDMSVAQHPITYLFELLKEVDFTIEDKNSFLKKYEEKVSAILNREGNENLKSLSGEAMEKLNDLISIISAAREGDKASFEKLQLFVESGSAEKRT